MRTLIEEVPGACPPEKLASRLRDRAGAVLLRSLPDADPITPPPGQEPSARYSFVTANPFLTFRSWGARCEIQQSAEDATDGRRGNPPARVRFGNPWRQIEGLCAEYESLEEPDLPFPLGGCFGFWGYDLKNFVEPKLSRRAVVDLDLPDCHLGFYDSLVAYDHHLGRCWIISTGCLPDGSRNERRARRQLEFWQGRLKSGSGSSLLSDCSARPDLLTPNSHPATIQSTLSRTEFLARVDAAQRYIRSGDIYQVNLSQRLAVAIPSCGWQVFERLGAVSPAPFAAYLDCGDFQIASSSPEKFLHLSGSEVQTRPIKGTRPRSADPTRDAQLAYELQTSSKELAELVMITDLLRNDLGRICEFGTVHVPELVRLERFAQVQHMVSTVTGRLRPELTHAAALSSCFPGGSITGAPKFRAMEIIDELEPVSRGPYTGALGYLGFNRESQLSILIRTAICQSSTTWFHVGAGIVADSDPAAEYEETLAKADGFLQALGYGDNRCAQPLHT